MSDAFRYEEDYKTLSEPRHSIEYALHLLEGVDIQHGLGNKYSLPHPLGLDPRRLTVGKVIKWLLQLVPLYVFPVSIHCVANHNRM